MDGFLPLALGWGRYSPSQRLDVLLGLSPDEVAKNIIFNLRWPRLLAALLTMSLPRRRRFAPITQLEALSIHQSLENEALF